MEVIKVDNLTKSYVKKRKKINVLKEISISFKSNKFYAIIGESGSGKSTFLNCLTLLTKIDKGNIYIKDKNIVALNDEELSKLRLNEVGYVYQQNFLLDYLTALENVLVPLLYDDRFSLEESKIKAKKMLEYVGLSDRINHYPNELSIGEKQRVNIARALINNSEIILADEPTSNLDYSNKIKILDMLKKIVEDKKTVIVVTHDETVLKYADTIYRLEKGKLVEDDNKK